MRNATTLGTYAAANDGGGSRTGRWDRAVALSLGVEAGGGVGGATTRQLTKRPWAATMVMDRQRSYLVVDSRLLKKQKRLMPF